MLYVFAGAIVLFIPVIIRILKNLTVDKDSVGTVAMPNLFAVIGMFGYALICVLSALYILKSYINGVALIVSLIITALSCAIYLSLRISYDDDSFTVVQFWGKAKKYDYTKITGMIPGVSGIVLCVGRKKIYLDSLAIGKDEFLYFAEDRYCESTGAFSIPDNETKLFRGNVLEPLPMIIVFAFVLAALLALACYMSYTYARDAAVSYDELSSDEIVFDAMELNNRVCRLYCGEQSYALFEYDDSAVEIEKSIRSGETLHIFFSESNGIIWEIRDPDGTDIISFEHIKQTINTINLKNMAIMWGTVVIFAAFAFFANYILCNPNKHPILAALLIKKEYRNW